MKTVDRVDVVTIHLTKPAVGHLFEFARSAPKLGAPVAMIGHPAGNPLSLSQGRYLGTRVQQGVPVLGVFLQAAEGASGSPLLKSDGKVMGVLQRGFARDSGGAVFGINLIRESGLPHALCKSYPLGGIIGCTPAPMVKPAPVPQPPPDPEPTCADKAYLTAVGLAWKAATDEWHAWTTGNSSKGQLDLALADIESASVASSSFSPDEVCSTGLQQAISLIDTIEDLKLDASFKVEDFLQTQPGTPEYDAALDAAGRALGSLGARIDEIDQAFANQ